MLCSISKFIKMSEDLKSKKRVVRDYIERVINTGNTKCIRDYISTNYIEEYNGERYELGIEGAINHVSGVRKTFPDLELKIENQICEGEWVSTYYCMRGTHKGAWMGIKPTHEKITIYGVNIDRVVNGKIVEHGGAANLLEPLININAIKTVNKSKN